MTNSASAPSAGWVGWGKIHFRKIRKENISYPVASLLSESKILNQEVRMKDIVIY